VRARIVGSIGSLALVVGLMGVWGSVLAGQPKPASAAGAIQQVLQKYAATINSAEFAKGPMQKRAELLRPFYRADSVYAKGQQKPIFLGPLSEPVSRGMESHIDNLLLNFEYLFRQKLTYGFRFDEVQIEADNSLGVVLALSTAGYASADGKTNFQTKGRSTLVLTKMSNGKWLISHEHMELYNPNSPGTLSKDQLLAEIARLAK